MSPKINYRGRVIIDGKTKGEALVSRSGFNILASLAKPSLKNLGGIRCLDQGNPDLYGKKVSGKILCLPETIGSTGGGLILQTVAKMNLAPRAMLFSGCIDSLAAAGVILARIWDHKPVITIDQLGPEFLQEVQTGQVISVYENGIIEIEL